MCGEWGLEHNQIEQVVSAAVEDACTDALTVTAV